MYKNHCFHREVNESFDINQWVKWFKSSTAMLMLFFLALSHANAATFSPSNELRYIQRSDNTNSVQLPIFRTDSSESINIIYTLDNPNVAQFTRSQADKWEASLSQGQGIIYLTLLGNGTTNITATPSDGSPGAGVIYQIRAFSSVEVGVTQSVVGLAGNNAIGNVEAYVEIDGQPESGVDVRYIMNGGVTFDGNAQVHTETTNASGRATSVVGLPNSDGTTGIKYQVYLPPEVFVAAGDVSVESIQGQIEFSSNPNPAQGLIGDSGTLFAQFRDIQQQVRSELPVEIVSNQSGVVTGVGTVDDRDGPLIIDNYTFGPNAGRTTVTARLINYRNVTRSIGVETQSPPSITIDEDTNNQIAVVNERLAQPLSAFYGQDGTGFPGQEMVWRVLTGQGRFENQTEDQAGNYSVEYIPTSVGTHSIQVAYMNEIPRAVFTVEVYNPSITISPSSVENIVGRTSGFDVVVRDGRGGFLADEQVNLRKESAANYASIPASVNTNTSGEATVTINHGPSTGSNTILASLERFPSVAAVSADYATVNPSLTKTGDNTELSGQSGTTITSSVSVLLSYGVQSNPISGEEITWTLSGTTGGASFADTNGATTTTVDTNQSGISSSPDIVLGQSTSWFTITASSSLLSTQQSFLVKPWEYDVSVDQANSDLLGTLGQSGNFNFAVAQISGRESTPAPGVALEFIVSAGSEYIRFDPPSPITDTSGEYRLPLDFGYSVGQSTIEVEIDGETYASVDTETFFPELEIVNTETRFRLGSAQYHRVQVAAYDNDGNLMKGGVSMGFEIEPANTLVDPSGSSNYPEASLVFDIYPAGILGDFQFSPRVTDNSQAFTETAHEFTTWLPQISFANTAPMSARAGDTIEVVVNVTDDEGANLVGESINWSLDASSTSELDPANEVTDGQGNAYASLTVNDAGVLEFIVESPTSDQSGEVSAEIAFQTSTLSIELDSGGGETGIVGERLDTPLSVLVTEDGQPAANIDVTWTITSSLGSGIASAADATSQVRTLTTTTTAAGLTEVYWWLGDTPGDYELTATTAYTTEPVTFNATAETPQYEIAISTGSPQRVLLGGSIAPLVALVTRLDGGNVEGAVVDWQIITGAGSFDDSVTQTVVGANGLTQNTYVNITQLEDYRITASMGNESVEFTGRIYQDATITTNGEVTGRSGLSTNVSVTVTDELGNPFDGQVDWSSSNTNIANFTNQTVSTNPNNGVATNEVQFEQTSGSATATVSVPDLDISTEFTINTYHPEISVVSGLGLWGIVGDALTTPFVVQVTDPVLGIALGQEVISWEVTQGVAEVINEDNETNDEGRAQGTLQLGGTAGSYVVTVSHELAGSVEFGATAFIPEITLSRNEFSGNSGDTFNVIAGVAANGEPVEGRFVDWSTNDASVATISPDSTELDTDGFAQATLTLGTAEDSTVLTASFEGLASTTATVTTNVPDYAVVIQGDRDRTGLVNQSFDNFVVRATADGQGVPTQEVSWVVTPESGTAQQFSSFTDTEGYAQLEYTAGSAAVRLTIEAIFEGSQDQFNVTVIDPVLMFDTIPTEGMSGTSFDVAVTLEDGLGNGLPDASLSWTSDNANAASLQNALTITNSAGESSNQLTFGNLEGMTSIQITNAEYGIDAFFNVDIYLPELVIASAQAQSGLTLDAVDEPFAVRSVDPRNNNQVIEGTGIEWSKEQSTGQFTSTELVTGSDGLASANFTYGDSTSSYDIIATDEYGNFVEFVAQSYAPTITIAPSSDIVGDAGSSIVLTATVIANGEPVIDRNVSWQVSGAQGVASLSSELTATDSAGETTVLLTHGATAGTASIAADFEGKANSSVEVETLVPDFGLVYVDGNDQQVRLQEALQPFAVRTVRDGQGIGEQSVQWEVVQGNGAPVSLITVSDDAGLATFTYGAVNAAERFIVRATYDGNVFDFAGTIFDPILTVDVQLLERRSGTSAEITATLENGLGDGIESSGVGWISENTAVAFFDQATTFTGNLGVSTNSVAFGSEEGTTTVTILSEDYDIEVDINVETYFPELNIVDGEGQFGLVNDQLNAFVVRSYDARLQQNLADTTISFEVTSGDGSFDVVETQTDTSGEASSTLTLGSNGGTNNVVVSDEYGNQVSFSAEAYLPTLALNEPTFSGDSGESVVIRASLAANAGNIEGREINWALSGTAGVANISSQSELTDADGMAEITLTFGSVEGDAVLTASYSDIVSTSADISTNVPDFGLNYQTGNDQSHPLGEAWAAFEVQVVRDGQGIAGESVSWVIDAGTGSLSELVSTTDTDGMASVTYSAGNVAEVVQVTATYQSFNQVFNGQSTDPAMTTSQNTFSGLNGDTFTLEVNLDDGVNGGMPNQAVVWTIESGVDLVELASEAETVTNSNGDATLGIRLADGFGSAVLRASALNGELTQDFNVTVSSYSISAVSAVTQTVITGMPVTAIPRVNVTMNNEPVENYEINWQPSSADVSVVDEQSFTADNGDASTGVTVVTNGQHTLTASGEHGQVVFEYNAESAQLTGLPDAINLQTGESIDLNTLVQSPSGLTLTNGLVSWELSAVAAGSLESESNISESGESSNTFTASNEPGTAELVVSVVDNAYIASVVIPVTVSQLNIDLSIVNGNDQRIFAGGRDSAPIQLQLLINDEPFAGAEVSWEISGDAQLVTAEAITTDEGLADITVRSLDAASQVLLTATVGDFGTVVANLNVIQPVVNYAGGDIRGLVGDNVSLSFDVTDGLGEPFAEAEFIANSNPQSLFSINGSSLVTDEQGNLQLDLSLNTLGAGSLTIIMPDYDDAIELLQIPVNVVSSDLVVSASSATQVALIGDALPNLIEITVTEGGQPVAGADINWAPTAGSLQQTQLQTNAQGIATTQWLMPRQAGEFQLNVTSDYGEATVVASAELPVLTASAASLQGLAESSTEFTITSTGIADSPLPNQPLQWDSSAVENIIDSSLLPATTDASGSVIVPITFLDEFGSGGLSVALTNYPEAQAVSVTLTSATISIASVGDAVRSAVKGRELPAPLSLLVQQSDGQAVQAAVSWEVTAGDAAIVEADEQTNEEGLANALLSVGFDDEQIEVTATVADVGSLSFLITPVASSWVFNLVEDIQLVEVGAENEISMLITSSDDEQPIVNAPVEISIAAGDAEIISSASVSNEAGEVSFVVRPNAYTDFTVAVNGVDDNATTVTLVGVSQPLDETVPEDTTSAAQRGIEHELSFVVRNVDGSPAVGVPVIWSTSVDAYQDDAAAASLETNETGLARLLFLPTAAGNVQFTARVGNRYEVDYSVSVLEPTGEEAIDVTVEAGQNSGVQDAGNGNVTTEALQVLVKRNGETIGGQAVVWTADLPSTLDYNFIVDGSPAGKRVETLTEVNGTATVVLSLPSDYADSEEFLVYAAVANVSTQFNIRLQRTRVEATNNYEIESMVNQSQELISEMDDQSREVITTLSQACIRKDNEDDATDEAISADHQDLLEICNALFERTSQADLLTDAERSALLGELAGLVEEILPAGLVAQVNTMIAVADIQRSTMFSRMSAIRGGSQGFQRSGLTLGIDGTPMNLDPLAKFLEGTDSGLQAWDSPWGGFVNGTFSAGHKDATDGSIEFDFTVKDVTAGLDYRVSNQVVVGGAFGYVNSDTDFSGSSGSIEGSAYNISLFGTYYNKRDWYVDALMMYGFNSDTVKHDVDLSVLGAGYEDVRRSSVDADGNTFSLSISSGADYTDNAMTFGPFVRLDYSRLTIDEFTEDYGTGQNGLALTIEEQTNDAFNLAMGGQATYAINSYYGVFTPQVRLDFRQEFKDDEHQVKARFSGNSSNESFTVSAEQVSERYFNAMIGMSAVLPHGKSAYIFYESPFGIDDYRRYSISAGMRWEF